MKREIVVPVVLLALVGGGAYLLYDWREKDKARHRIEEAIQKRAAEEAEDKANLEAEKKRIERVLDAYEPKLKALEKRLAEETTDAERTEIRRQIAAAKAAMNKEMGGAGQDCDRCKGDPLCVCP